MLVDPFGRKITYLRISVTDRCNFRCRYCFSIKNWKKLRHEDILRFEEFLEIVKTGLKLGINKVRITGGEPLVRKGIEFFVKNLAELSELKDLGLTTNGYFLEELGRDLKRAGLKRINISLDTLNKDKFKWLTGVDGLERVIKGIELALKLGFDPIKLNTVVIRGFNDDELIDLARLTLEMPVEVRFIEFMPVGKNPFWDESHVISGEEIKRILEEIDELIPLDKTKGSPSKVFKWKRAKGRIGLITPLSNPFCSECNRLRITADGRIRPCLFSNFEINLKPILRQGMGSLEEAFLEATKKKPEKISFLEDSIRYMRSIGG